MVQDESVLQNVNYGIVNFDLYICIKACFGLPELALTCILVVRYSGNLSMLVWKQNSIKFHNCLLADQKSSSKFRIDLIRPEA